MEGMFLQSVPVAGSLVAAALLLAMVVGAVAYGWLCQRPRTVAAQHEPLKKAA